MAPLNISVVTFNCARVPIESSVFANCVLRFLGSDSFPDLLVFSLQEISPIAYAFLGGSFLTFYLDRVRHTVDVLSQQCTEELQQDGYTQLVAKNVGMTALLIFARGDVVRRIRRLENGGVGVGWWSMGNKGALGSRFQVLMPQDDSPNSFMNLAFLAVHLAPMEDATARRNKDWSDVVKRLVFLGKTSATNTNNRHTNREESQRLLEGTNSADAELLPTGIYSPGSCVFLAGDLNYRTSDVPPRGNDVTAYPKPVADGEIGHFAKLWKGDQLSQELTAKRTLHGFHEEPVHFPPTYKYSDAQRDSERAREKLGPQVDVRPEGVQQDSEYGWASHRWPSWCDRILYLRSVHRDQDFGQGAEVHVLKYTALPLMSTSDHRPVAMSVSIRAGVGESELDNSAWTADAPFEIDPQWQQKRKAARQGEIVVGFFAFLGLTWEGRAVTFGILAGSVVLWTLLQR